MITYASGEETALFGAGFAETPSLLDSTKQKSNHSLSEPICFYQPRKLFKTAQYLAAIALE